VSRQLPKRPRIRLHLDDNENNVVVVIFVGRRVYRGGQITLNLFHVWLSYTAGTASIHIIWDMLVIIVVIIRKIS
jgi:hypothetical protein